MNIYLNENIIKYTKFYKFYILLISLIIFTILLILFVLNIYFCGIIYCGGPNPDNIPFGDVSLSRFFGNDPININYNNNNILFTRDCDSTHTMSSLFPSDCEFNSEIVDPQNKTSVPQVSNPIYSTQVPYTESEWEYKVSEGKDIIPQRVKDGINNYNHQKVKMIMEQDSDFNLVSSTGYISKMTSKLTSKLRDLDQKLDKNYNESLKRHQEYVKIFEQNKILRNKIKVTQRIKRYNSMYENKR